MLDAVTWWLAVEMIGLIAFPVTFLFFRFLPDRGYSFSKVVGLLLLSYLVWLGATARIIPNERWSIILTLVLLGSLSAGLAYRSRHSLVRFLRDKWIAVASVEALFTVSYAYAVIFRSHNAVIEQGGENQMDFAFINAITRSDHFPPHDPWLSGHDLSYYYFPHLNIALLTELTGISSAITFNLAIGLFLALSVIAAFGLVYSLLASRASTAAALSFGVLSAVFLMGLGNLIGLFEILAAHSVGSESFYGQVDVFSLDGPRESTAWYPTEFLWYLRAANFVYGGPDRQFPFYAFMTGFLHMEFMSIVYILVGLATVLNLWKSPAAINARFLLRRPAIVALTALSIGVVGFTNPWALPAVLGLLALVILVRNVIPRTAGGYRLAVQILLPTAVIVGLAFILYLPYYLTFSGPTPDMRPVEAARTVRLDAMVTEPHHLLYMWLPLLSLSLVFAASVLLVRSLKPARAALATLAALLPLAIWAALVLRHGPDGLADEISARGTTLITLAILTALLWVTCAALVTQAAESRDDLPSNDVVPGLALAGTGIMLVIGVELFFVKTPIEDIRFNTVLKLGYQSWVLLAPAAALGLYYFLSGWRWRKPYAVLALRLSAATAVAVLVIVALIYPVSATFWRTASFSGQRDLNGFSLLKRFNPDEYTAISWVRENVDGAPIILEATGGDYSAFSFVSASTGLPTILGWPQHELQWRGTTDPQTGRAEAVERAFKTTDPNEARLILVRYDVEYVYAGPLEKVTYGDAGLTKFQQFMDVVFRNKAVTIYKMPDS